MQLTLQLASNQRRHADQREALPRRDNVALWIVQALLALLFLMAGGFKLAAPPEMMSVPLPLPIAFLRFIGACEVLGALGLILPGLTHIRPGLTPLAAAGLVIIMIGATVVTVIGSGVVPALFPLLVGTLAASVAYGRGRLARRPGRRASDRGARPSPALQAAA